MSEVQKFKENRKIFKAQGGVKTSAPREETIGDWVREKNRSLFGSGMRWYNRNSPVGRQAIAMKTETRVKGADGREWILKLDGTKILASLRGNKPATTSSASVAFSPISPEFRDEYKDKEETVQQSTTNTTTTKTGKTGRTGKVNNRINRNINRPNYAKNFNNLNLSQNEIDYILDKGFDPYSAEGVQNFILSESGQIDLGSRKGIGTADGLWGQKSQNAFKALRDKGIFKSQVEEPVVEPVVDAPDPFGYKTSNTYEDDDFVSKLKKMGIRSNADLMYFMYESKKPNWQGDAWTTQFRNDVDRLLGGDYSDDNIRRVLKTKNGWGNGFMGRGDFGDFQNILQTNAGVWNGMYDAKEQASRTGASGTVYSSPEMMRKFESIKLQPNQNNQELTSGTKFDFSNMKFNNIFTGNTGASTLGNIPSTKSQPINLSQEFIKGLTPSNSGPLKLSNTQLSGFDTSYEGLA